MTKLRERTVQAKALYELERRYRMRGAKYVYACCEVRTKKEKGGKRADGLICFKQENGQYYTVSLEAKSHRTLGNLVSFVNDNKLGKYCVASAAAVTFLTMVLMISFSSLMWYILAPIALITFFVFSLVSIWVFDSLDLDRHKESDIIEQLKQYPANEQWIAYSKYAYNQLADVPSKGRKPHQLVLNKLCEDNGFGLMLISNQKAEIAIKPKVKKGSYLSVYCKEREITDYLESGGTLVYRNPCRVAHDGY